MWSSLKTMINWAEMKERCAEIDFGGAIDWRRLPDCKTYRSGLWKIEKTPRRKEPN